MVEAFSETYNKNAFFFYFIFNSLCPHTEIAISLKMKKQTLIKPNHFTERLL